MAHVDFPATLDDIGTSLETGCSFQQARFLLRNLPPSRPSRETVTPVKTQSSLKHTIWQHRHGKSMNITSCHGQIIERNGLFSQAQIPDSYHIPINQIIQEIRLN